MGVVAREHPAGKVAEKEMDDDHQGTSHMQAMRHHCFKEATQTKGGDETKEKELLNSQKNLQRHQWQKLWLLQVLLLKRIPLRILSLKRLKKQRKSTRTLQDVKGNN